MHKLFEFSTDERLFHFLTDTTNASGIEVITPHLLDEQPAVPTGVLSAGNTSSAPAVPPTPPPAETSAAIGTAQNDPFLKSLFNANKEQKGDDLMLQSLIRSEEKDVEKKKSILGELPKIDTSLFIDREFHLKKQLSYVKIAFASVVTLGFVLFIFFYAQLDPNFDLTKNPNIGKQLSSTNSQLKSLQTQINFYRYSTAKQNLDQFFYNANEYLQKYDAWKSSQDEEKATLLTQLDAARADVVNPFEAAREKLSKSLFVTLYREIDPVPNRAAIGEEVAAQEEKNLAIQEFEVALREHISTKQQNAGSDDLRELNELSTMIGNKKLLTLVSTDLSKMTHEDLRKFILQMSENYTQRLAFIFHIKDRRIPWYGIINEIYDKTASIDKGRFKTKLYNDVGGVQYTGFDFDGTTGRINISGNVKDYDGVNFTIMADLIDVLERSSMFKDVEMRNFSKTFTEKDGFEGNFKIDLALQNADESDSRDKAVNLNQLPNVFDSSKPKS